jgi:tetratricopeptide (TPR) repeat protein
MLGWINLKTGNLEAALKWCIESWENAKDAATEYYPTPYISINFKGQVLLEMKRIEEAQKTAEELREHIEKGSFRKIKRMYYHLMGMIEQKKENYSKAIEYFQQALSLIPIQRTGAWGINQQAAFIDSLAQAYFESGDLEKAELEYRKILGLTIGRLYQGDIYAKTF